MKRSSLIETIFSVIFILFWLAVIYIKLEDFQEFRREMSGQVFPKAAGSVLIYVLPVIWFGIAAMLVSEKTRLTGMLVNVIVLLSLCVYVGLAVLNVYVFKPCSCAGLFDFGWEGQFWFNLVITAVAVAGLIFTFKDRERRKAVWTG